MLLNRDNNLVLPPRSITSAKGETTTEEAASAPVALDLRIGPNIRLGIDPSALPSNMRAQAEPHIARAITNEDFLVGVFQEGRFATGGGAVDCGYSISHDGGLSWTRALIPHLNRTLGGSYFRATDPVVAFDLNNNVYLETLVATDSQFINGAVVLSKSTYGGANSDRAPIRRVYSDNGGATWSSTSVISTETTLQGSQPLYLPNGNCMVVYWNFGTPQQPGERLEAVISTDGGNTFGSPNLITSAVEYNEPSIRTGSFYLQPWQTERHRIFTLCIKRCSEVIRGLLLPSQQTAGRVGARRLQLVIIPRGWECSIRPSMFRRMAGPSRLSFMTIGIIRALVCWLTFTWRNLLMAALPGNPTSGLLLYQPMLRKRH